MQTDEIKTVIILSGTNRMSDLEIEIFANEELTTLYLNNLCKEYNWYDSYMCNKELTFAYACTNGYTRWPEAEHVIAADPKWAHYYARDVIGGRWPEAEAAIKTDEDYWEWYCEDFGITDE